MQDKKRIQIRVSGIVQGVGFRPFIYRLARRLDLCGFVNNNSNGVLIEVEGNVTKLTEFFESLTFNPPPLAQITALKQQEIPIRGETTFTIIESEQFQQRRTLVSPDIATCPDCLTEIADPGDRRYFYPFTNCTNCGPRYTIIFDIPYDRPKTSMAGFKMCPVCQAEYDDPANRRFHAQPNACPDCGPHLQYLSRASEEKDDNPVISAITALKKGLIVAIKGIGGFHLAVDACNDQAVRTLRRRKKRFEKPLALMVHNEAIARQIVHTDEQLIKHLRSQHRPIVLCKKLEGTPLSPEISPDNAYLGIMLPYSPLHELLFTDPDLQILVMTSANLSEEPICFENDECLARMDEIADSFLLNDRDIYIRCDDSVLQVFNGEPFFIRRSRGYTPRPIILKRSAPAVLAVGGHLKNTVCLTRDKEAILSQHIGDLENIQTMAAFEQSIGHLIRLFEVEPVAVIHDLHPDYLSTRWAAEKCDLPTYPLQHHYAHILSVMAEHGLEDELIGFSLDGTGYGGDGTIWGGEILLCDAHRFERLAHFDYLPMPGGEKAIHEPWRMAVAYLHACFENGIEIASRYFPEKAPFLPLIGEMIAKQINTPLTSSCGRLFDAVAALLNLRTEVAYEGQAAVILEAAALDFNGDLPDIGEFSLNKKNGQRIIEATGIIKKIIFHKDQGTPVPALSRAFHQSLIDLFSRLAVELREVTGIGKIALSGGCFQNLVLLSGLIHQLQRMNFTVYINRMVPPNDGGLSLGQAWWGMHNVRT
jgi:hydrogenase maturation protein HypF